MVSPCLRVHASHIHLIIAVLVCQDISQPQPEGVVDIVSTIKQLEPCHGRRYILGVTICARLWLVYTPPCVRSLWLFSFFQGMSFNPSFVHSLLNAFMTGQAAYNDLVRESSARINRGCGWNARQYLCWRLVTEISGNSFSKKRDLWVAIVRERKRKYLASSSGLSHAVGQTQQPPQRDEVMEL